MKELWILRHAKSSWKDVSLQDFDRPLKGRGKRNAETMGRYFKQHQITPDAVLCSPAMRTCQTLERVMEVCKWPRSIVNFEPRIYEASADTLEAILQQQAHSCQRVLLIGHNPGLEMLMLNLVRTAPTFPDGKVLPTGTFAQIRLEPQAKLVRLVQPRALDPDTCEVVDAERTFFDVAS